MSGVVRVAFAGLAHTHPFTDAGNLRAMGAEICAVFDDDRARTAEFADRFDAPVVSDLAALVATAPDLIIATPRTSRAALVAEALATAGVPVFFNKVVAATGPQLDAWERAIEGANREQFGTASVLRFAPQLAELVDALDGQNVLAVRVLAQHDNAGFQVAGREWQDDPADGGGTLATVGVHAWELIDVLLPGARLTEGSGWTSRREGATTRSEDAAGVSGLLRLPSNTAGDGIRVEVMVTGVPGPDRYTIDVVTAGGIHGCVLDAENVNVSLGFAGLITALLESAPNSVVPTPWHSHRSVVVNTINAAHIARHTGDRVG